MTRQEHLLTIIAEECAEVAQRASKALRFGIDEVQEGQEKTNHERLIEEFNDLYSAVYMLNGEHGGPDSLLKADYIMEKRWRIEKWLEYSAEQGTLQSES